jgi:hypothetical protein
MFHPPTIFTSGEMLAAGSKKEKTRPKLAIVLAELSGAYEWNNHKMTQKHAMDTANRRFVVLIPSAWLPCSVCCSTLKEPFTRGLCCGLVEEPKE